MLQFAVVLLPKTDRNTTFSMRNFQQPSRTDQGNAFGGKKFSMSQVKCVGAAHRKANDVGLGSTLHSTRRKVRCFDTEIQFTVSGDIQEDRHGPMKKATETLFPFFHGVQTVSRAKEAG